MAISRTHPQKAIAPCRARRLGAPVQELPKFVIARRLRRGNLFLVRTLNLHHRYFVLTNRRIFVILEKDKRIVGCVQKK